MSKNSWQTRPWARVLAPGVFASTSKEVWVYKALPLAPLEWEDAARRLEHQAGFERLLIELGETSRDMGQGVRVLSQNRTIHVLTVQYEERAEIDPRTPPMLATFQNQVLFDTVPRKVLAFGVKLRRDAVSALSADTSDDGMIKRASKALKSATQDPTDLTLFVKDLERVNALLGRAGGVELTTEQTEQVTSWFNLGQGVDTVVAATSNKLQVTSGEKWQVCALLGTDEQGMSMQSPHSGWLLDAMNHPEPAVAVSIRSELEPSNVTRGRLRKQQRVLADQQQEEEATGDIGREEIGEKAAAAKDIENYTRSAGHAWLSKTSVLFARRIYSNEPDETFVDLLRGFYGMDVQVLEKRQLKGLSEMLPGSTERVNPFPQDVNPAWLAYSGISGFGDIGDPTGLLLGSADPQWTNVFVDEFAAANRNKTPIMGIFGEPGSGKTFAAQLLTAQAALSGKSAIFINPKGFDSLKDFAGWVASAGAQSQIVSMQKLEKEGGAFDPFRFTEPKMAAEILARHINAVLGVTYSGGLSGKQEVELGRGLSQGANEGARCAFDALQFVRDPEIIEQVTSMVEASTLFALAFGREEQEPWTASSGLTLIEFDREMPLPAAGKDSAYFERDERIAVAALRLVSRASLEILMRSKGGVLVVDEAHHFLGSSEGLATLERIGREGRSLGLLPIFATQRVTDLLKVDMESFMSRVLALKLTDPKESEAALRLCRLEATPARKGFLASAGAGSGFFRDLDDRHSVIQVGAGVPEDLRMAMSTNRADRLLKEIQAGGDGVE